MRKRWFACLMLLVLVGCGSSPSVVTVVVTAPPATFPPNASATATRAGELTQLATVLVPTATPMSTPQSTSTAPTRSATPEASATRAPAMLNIVAQGYGQNDRSVGYAFIVENADTKAAVDFSQYLVAAYDAAGHVLRMDHNYITVVFPGQRLGVAGEIFLPQNIRVVDVQFDVSPGHARPFAGSSPLSTEDVFFQGNPLSGGSVTGVVKSVFPRDLRNITVSAIAYDARGVIIGGGQSVVDRVPANGQAPAEVTVTLNGPPARVELFPTFSR